MSPYRVIVGSSGDRDGEIILEHAPEAAPVRRGEPLERAVHVERECGAAVLDGADDRARDLGLDQLLDHIAHVTVER